MTTTPTTIDSLAPGQEIHFTRQLSPHQEEPRVDSLQDETAQQLAQRPVVVLECLPLRIRSLNSQPVLVPRLLPQGVQASAALAQQAPQHPTRQPPQQLLGPPQGPQELPQEAPLQQQQRRALRKRALPLNENQEVCIPKRTKLPPASSVVLSEVPTHQRPVKAHFQVCTHAQILRLFFHSIKYYNIIINLIRTQYKPLLSRQV